MGSIKFTKIDNWMDNKNVTQLSKEQAEQKFNPISEEAHGNGAYKVGVDPYSKEETVMIEISMNMYQNKANETAIYPNKGTIQGLCYTALGLGEAGEVQGKVKKILRDDDGVLFPDKQLNIAQELGDILWYVAMTAHEIGFSLDQIARMNMDKLSSRKDRGVIKGSGDHR